MGKEMYIRQILRRKGKNLLQRNPLSGKKGRDNQMSTVEEKFMGADKNKKSEESGEYGGFSFSFYLWEDEFHRILSGIKVEKRRFRPGIRYVNNFYKMPDPNILAREVVQKMHLKGKIINTPEKEDRIVNFLREKLIIPAIKDLSGKLGKLD
jgi:hypothetical protein